MFLFYEIRKYFAIYVFLKLNLFSSVTYTCENKMKLISVLQQENIVLIMAKCWLQIIEAAAA